MEDEEYYINRFDEQIERIQSIYQKTYSSSLPVEDQDEFAQQLGEIASLYEGSSYSDAHLMAKEQERHFRSIDDTVLEEEFSQLKSTIRNHQQHVTSLDRRSVRK